MHYRRINPHERYCADFMDVHYYRSPVGLTTFKPPETFRGACDFHDFTTFTTFENPCAARRGHHKKGEQSLTSFLSKIQLP